MTDKNKNRERFKLALIPVLALILIGVLISNGSEDSTPSAQAAAPAAASPVESGAKTAQNSPVQGRPAVQTTVWPMQPLSEIVSHNPFELRDPRALLDAAFAEYGLTEEPQLTEVTVEEFFEEERRAHEFAIAQQRQLINSVIERFFPQAAEAAATEDDLSEPEVENLADAPDFVPVDAGKTEATQEQQQQEARALAELKKLQQRIASLQREPVKMVMETNRGKSALLRGRRVAEGESLENGIRVSTIDRNGITFEIDQPTTAE